MKRRRDILYILRDNNGKIIAISEEDQLISQYISQFFEYFKCNKCEVERTTDKYKIINTLNSYLDTAVLQTYSDNIVFTEFEYKFYDIHFKKIYNEFKSTITSLISFKNYIYLNDQETEKMSDVFELMYGKCSSFDEFIKNVKPSFIFSNIITDPILSKNNIKELEELMEKMEYSISKED